MGNGIRIAIISFPSVEVHYQDPKLKASCFEVIQGFTRGSDLVSTVASVFFDVPVKIGAARVV